MNSFLFLCRRTERVPVTSTDLIFLPTTSFSRSRRKTSTSGSSGMVAPLTVSLVLQARPCDPRGGLFGLLLRMALALAVHALAHVDHREEVLRMIRALVADDVPRTPERTGRGGLLQTGLVIAPTRARGGIGDPLREAPHDEVARDGKSLIEIYRGHD